MNYLEEISSIPWTAAMLNGILTDNTEYRTVATVRAYKKLRLIQADANDDDLMKVIVDAYRQLAGTHGDIGELYLAVPLENGSVMKLYRAFHRAFKAYDTPSMPLWGQHRDSDFGVPKVDLNKVVVRVMVTGDECSSYEEVGAVSHRQYRCRPAQSWWRESRAVQRKS